MLSDAQAALLAAATATPTATYPSETRRDEVVLIRAQVYLDWLTKEAK